PFDFGNVFPFSYQDGTKASVMEPKIPSREIKRRMKDALKFLKKKNYFTWYFRPNTGISFYAR
ncbi:MAG: hypothetical protein JSW60_07530, partial [Thermoplasmatales archaeon]